LRRLLSLAIALAPAVVLADIVPVPTLTGRVVDGAGAFSPEESRRLVGALEALEREHGVQMAVLTVPTLGDEPIEAFSLRVVEAWKLGKKGDDRGLLFVFVPSERKMRLEVGYGLEGTIPDAVAKRIVADRVRPYFRDRRYADGALTAVEAVRARLGRADTSVPREIVDRRRGESPLRFVVVFFLLLFLLASAMLGAGQRRRPLHRGWGGGWGGGGWTGGSGGGWGSGGFGGGGGGFGGGGGGFGGGGGGFGGGGASSDW
jgi:uncharacterized protein